MGLDEKLVCLDMARLIDLNLNMQSAYYSVCFDELCETTLELLMYKSVYDPRGFDTDTVNWHDSCEALQYLQDEEKNTQLGFK